MDVLTKLWLPGETPSVANLKIHWGDKRIKHQRRKAELLTLSAGLRAKPLFAVHLVRVGKRMLDSHDNLRMALKKTADGVADGLGRKDDSKGIEWTYDQRTGPELGVEITIGTP